MLSGVPNFAFTVGYTNASWTLKADLVARVRVPRCWHMAAHGYRRVVPVRDPSVGEQPFMDFTSGYVLRALNRSVPETRVEGPVAGCTRATRSTL